MRRWAMVNETIDRGRVEMVSWGEQPLRSRDDLARLYELEHAPMVRLATLLLGGQARAEEVVHDAFITVFQRRDGIDRPGAYLRRTVVNNCYDVQRRGGTEQRKLELVSQTTDSRAVALPPDFDETWLALGALSHKQRTALVLRFYEDLTIDAVADVMGERPGTVKSLVHRGLKTLRTEMER